MQPTLLICITPIKTITLFSLVFVVNKPVYSTFFLRTATLCAPSRRPRTVDYSVLPTIIKNNYYSIDERIFFIISPDLCRRDLSRNFYCVLTRVRAVDNENSLIMSMVCAQYINLILITNVCPNVYLSRRPYQSFFLCLCVVYRRNLQTAYSSNVPNNMYN